MPPRVNIDQCADADRLVDEIIDTLADRWQKNFFLTLDGDRLTSFKMQKNNSHEKSSSKSKL